MKALLNAVRPDSVVGPAATVQLNPPTRGAASSANDGVFRRPLSSKQLLRVNPIFDAYGSSSSISQTVNCTAPYADRDDEYDERSLPDDFGGLSFMPGEDPTMSRSQSSNDTRREQKVRPATDK